MTQRLNKKYNSYFLLYFTHIFFSKNVVETPRIIRKISSSQKELKY